MWSSDRRLFVLGGMAVLAGCGFRPLYGEQNAGAAAIVGDVALQEASDPETYAYRERLRRRIGDAGAGAVHLLLWEISMEETGVAITRTSDITRYQVVGIAKYRLIAQANGVVVQEGSVKASGAYDATAEAFATRAAMRDERIRIAEELAELSVTRILAAASG